MSGPDGVWRAVEGWLGVAAAAGEAWLAVLGAPAPPPVPVRVDEESL